MRCRQIDHSRSSSGHQATVVSQLSAARIGRDASVDWMSVAAIPSRDWALTAEPSISAVAIGIAFTNGRIFPGRWSSSVYLGNGPPTLVLVRSPWRPCRGRSGARMVHPGAIVSVLAADLHIAAALLDRFSGSSFVGIHVSAIRLASLLAFRTQGIRGQNVSPGLEPWNYSPPTGRRKRRDVLPATGRSGRVRSHTIGP